MERFLNDQSPNATPNGRGGETPGPLKSQRAQGDGCIAQLVEQLTLNQPPNQRFQRPEVQTELNRPLKSFKNFSRFPNAKVGSRPKGVRGSSR